MWDGKDRRSGPDWITKSINVLNALSWVGFIVALAFFHFARPEMNNIILHVHNIPVRESWIVSLREWMFISLYLSIVMSLLTLVVNRIRMKRRSDHQRFNALLLIMVVAGFIAIVQLG